MHVELRKGAMKLELLYFFFLSFVFNSRPTTSLGLKCRPVQRGGPPKTNGPKSGSQPAWTSFACPCLNATMKHATNQ